MSKSDNTYSVACNCLWNSLSLFHFIFDDLITPELYEASIAWIHYLEAIANWAGDEAYFPSSKTEASQVNLYMTDEYGDYLIKRWANSLNTIAHNAYITRPEIPQLTYLYSSYCLYLAALLTRFSDLIKQHTSPKYQRRYDLVVHNFDELHKLILNVSFLPQISQFSDALRKVLEAETELIANEWKALVLSAAINGLPTKAPQN